MTLLKGDEYLDIALTLPHVLAFMELEDKIITPAKHILEVLLRLKRRSFTVRFPLAASRTLAAIVSYDIVQRCPPPFAAIYRFFSLPLTQRESLGTLLEAQQAFETSLQESGLKKYGGESGLNVVKMHDLTHHLMAIMLFEHPSLYSTQAGERLNGDIKDAYQRGNKKDNEQFVRGPFPLSRFLSA